MTTRRLAAILAADVVGFSSMMEKDEEGTLRRVKALQREVIEPKVRERGGRLVKTTGDGFLCEFGSPVEAVRCALEIQETTKANGEPVLLRMGINLGYIIIEPDGDIYGEGVNVAARLEQLADPGGLCISGSVHEHAEGKIPVLFESRGEQQVKNIARPVRVFSLAGTRTTQLEFLIGGRPSIAVLPFDNMAASQDDYFADGITEDIITALTRIRWVHVVARNSVFGYKREAKDIRQVARDLGASYVLEGSVRKGGNRVRLTAQLIDGTTGNHVWAKRYDRELHDIFEVQDDLTESIVASVEPELGKAERERAVAKRPESLSAWDLGQRGMWHLYRRTKADFVEAQTLFQKALKLEPNLVPALCGLSEVHVLQVLFGFASEPAWNREEAMRLARRAVDLDDQNPLALFGLGRAHVVAHQHEEAIPYIEAALALNLTLAWAQYLLGLCHVYSGRAERGLPYIQSAINLSPHDPYAARFMSAKAEAHLFLGEYEEAAACGRQALRQANRAHWSGHTALAAALGYLGRAEEASKIIQDLLHYRPDFSVEMMKEAMSLRREDYLADYFEGLRRAGLPK